MDALGEPHAGGLAVEDPRVDDLGDLHEALTAGQFLEGEVERSGGLHEGLRQRSNVLAQLYDEPDRAGVAQGGEVAGQVGRGIGQADSDGQEELAARQRPRGVALPADVHPPHRDI